ncbi:hypothetical protein [Streptomyces sp. NPDC058548]|uniref:hypothetical protein n=1 Tax=unclassified Streptomyces TaxID=2593676 RepID=UPI00364EA56C
MPRPPQNDAPLSCLLLPPDSPSLPRQGDTPSADVIVLDLQAHPQGRRAAEEYLTGPERSFDVPVWLRVHPFHTPACVDDLTALARLSDALAIPGVRTAVELDRIAVRSGGIPLVPVIDSLPALIRAPSLARHEHVLRLGFTSVTASSELTDGMLTVENTAAWVHRIVAASSMAAGLPGPVGGLCPDVPDADTLLTEARTALASGFTGYCVSDPGRLPELRALFDDCLAPFGRFFS